MRTYASFMVLLDDTSRALLFDSDHHLLGEVIEDDGFIVESLLRGANECPLPCQSILRAVKPAPLPTQPMRCFALC